MKTRSTKQQINDLAERALAHVRSVTYKVSVRWLFYRLLQDGLYNAKENYSRFVQIVSRWRHEGKAGWQPNILADETREAILSGIEEMTPANEMSESIIQNLHLWTLDSHFKYQDFYVEVWFEARAMIGQFKKYAPNITLCPFGGYTSIPMKWEIAKRLEHMNNRFEKPIVVLYFGDCDDAGFEILESSVEGGKGLRKWCDTDFKVIRCGLTKQQAKKYRIPENPEKPGQFQWEALNDEQARIIITKCISRYVNHEAIERVNRESLELNEKFAERIRQAFIEYGGV